MRRGFSCPPGSRIKPDSKVLAWETKSYMSKSLCWIRKEAHDNVESEGVCVCSRVVQGVGTEVRSSIEPLRILFKGPSRIGIVVSGAVI